MFNDKTILVTGGTGSFGKKFVKILLERYRLKRLIVYSRDELKQFEMQQTYHNDCMRYSLVMFAMRHGFAMRCTRRTMSFMRRR